VLGERRIAIERDSDQNWTAIGVQGEVSECDNAQGE